MVDVAGPDPAHPSQAQPQEPLKLVCFWLHGQEYALDIADIKETMAVKPITRVFLTPPWLSGIINLRGDIVAVLDLAQLLGMPAVAVTGDSRIIICQRQGKVAGILVDELAELRMVPEAAIAPPPVTLASEGAQLLRGVATLEDGAPLRVLDLESLFAAACSRPPLRQTDGAHSTAR